MIRPVLLLCSLLVLGPGEAVAGTDDPGLQRLRNFLTGVTTLRADFRQRVIDSRQQLVEDSAGRVLMQRPGRFRWDYQQPHARAIVADGEKLWLYEADLDQVIIRQLEEGIGDTPAALLTGRQDVLERFTISKSWQADKIQWVALAPKAADADFAGVRLGFDGQKLVNLELDDRLGQQTRLDFSRVEINPRLDDQSFHFDIPPGADVIDDSAL
ncbi:MAG: outer membrane lipoprotein chaperone LolA [Gammaproteobacteria bacterium]|jgi:outer membrane lipoprotein carrier protein|nr:outer membrane lipoprotein chaperone LolA [Gammaproteobacteria bacterium]